MINIIVIPMLLITIGMIGLFKYDVYDALKDGWYFTNLFIPVLVGYAITKNEDLIATVLPIFVYSALIGAIAHVSKFVVSPPEHWEIASVIRETYGAGRFLSVVGLSIIVFSWQYGVRIFRSRFFEYTAILLFLVSIFLSQSRILIGFSIIAMLVGVLRPRKISHWVLASALVCAIGIFVTVVNLDTLPVERKSLSGKFLSSYHEIMPANYYDMVDIHQRWRGYETYQGLKTYLSGGYFELVFGHGFGKLSDMQITMLLGDSEHRYIPVFHNGYVYAMVKTGFVGLLLYLLYVMKFLRAGWYAFSFHTPESKYIGKMLIFWNVAILIATFVLAGMFSRRAFFSVMIMLGCLLAQIDYITENARRASPD